jgi:hypothetical protein
LNPVATSPGWKQFAFTNSPNGMRSWKWRITAHSVRSRWPAPRPLPF